MSLTDRLVKKISSELNYDEEKSAVISYGIFAFLQILTSIAIVTLFGLLLGVVFQVLVVSFSISILRQYSGGIHATRPSLCLILGTIATIAIALIVHYLISLIIIEVNLSIIIVIMALSFYLVIKLAPVDSPEKPIRTQSKKNKMKKLSLIVLSLYLICIAVLIIFSYVKGNIRYLEFAMCICLASGWQVFTLTVKGHRFLRKVDSVLNKLIFNPRRITK